MVLKIGAQKKDAVKLTKLPTVRQIDAQKASRR
jgi:hypothetical protein